MRSFSKKLAFVLAAAMVFTAFAPAAKAEAAAMKINKSSKILYVTDGEGINDAAQVGGGKGNVAEYDFSVSNKPKDYKKTYTFEWSSSDEDVIEVGKAGLTKAVGVGVADVICVVTEKATGKATTLKSEVTVKANAAEVVITNADDYADLAYEVGAEIDLNRAMYDAEGNKAPKRGVKVTDYTRWMVEPSAGVKVTQSNGKYVFTDAAEAGTYKLWCETYQSSKYTKATAKSQVIEVELVKEKTFEVDQTAVNKFDLFFGEEANIAISDVTVNKIIKVGNSTGKIPMVVSSVSMSEDKTKAGISLFTHFENGVNYEISVKGYDEAVTMVAFVGKPVSMSISSKSGIQNGAFVVISNPTQLTYTMYDAQGNDVTKANTTTGYVTFSAANSATGDYYVTSDSVCIYKEGAEVVVDAVYHTGEFDGTANELTVKGSGHFVGVKAAPINVADVKLAVQYSWGGDYANNQVPVSDDKAYLKLQIKTTAYQDELTTYESGDLIGKLDPSGNNIPVVTFRSSNPDVMDVDKANANAIKLFKTGTAAVLVDLTTRGADGNPVVTTIASTLVTVTAKREAGSIQVGNNGTLTIGTVENFNSGKINVVVKDQYGSNMEIDSFKDVEVKLATGNKNANSYVALVPSSSANGYNNQAEVTSSILDLVLDQNDEGAYVWPAGKNDISVHVTGKAVLNKWQYNYYSEKPFNFVVNVRREIAGQSGYMLEASGTTSGNIGRFNDNNNNNDTEKEKEVVFKVFNTSNSIKTSQATVSKKTTVGVPESAAVNDLYYVVTRNGEDITVDTSVVGKDVKVKYSVTNNDKKMLVDNAVITGPAVVTYSTSNYKTLGAGTYTFIVYKVVKANNSDALSWAYVGSTSTGAVTCDIGSYSFVKRTSETVDHVKNNVEYSFVSGSVDAKASQEALRDCFEIKGRNGKVTDTPVYYVDAVETDKYVNVKSITFYEELTGFSGVYAPYTVNINVSLKK